MKLGSIDECKQLLEIFINSYFSIVMKHHYDPVATQPEADNRMWFQMILSKALNIKRILGGIEFEGDAWNLKNVIDPTILLTLVRNLFETVCAFEIVTMIPNTREKKLILYNLHCISGFRYRQRFASPELSEEHQAKLRDEAEYIQKLIKEIKETDLYKSLQDREKSKIDNAIRDKKYQIRITDDNRIKLYGWGDIPPLFGVRPLFYENAYTYFCLNAHPSHISMIQFRDMFTAGEEEYIQISITAMQFCFVLLSIYLSDYIRLFPQIMNTYNDFSIENQILLNYYNTLSRGYDYSISDAWKMLG